VIELLVFDVDGCLSDGRLLYTNNGDEGKFFDTRDGFGIVCWHALGKKSAIITGKTSKIVELRAKDLGIEYVFQGVKDKLATLDALLKKLDLRYENVAAIGDDLNDYKQLAKVGWSFAPSDALEFIRLHVQSVLNAKGGRGAVREMIDMIVEHENLREEFVKHWL
jgi:3-deoxy-D-manno-octulosonate 8-phosphate phosphatase (KDO 8-P phosphatase)